MNEIRILALTKYDRCGASSRLRTYQFLPYLEKAGVDVTVSPLFTSEYLSAMYAKKRGRSTAAALRAYFKRVRVLLTAGRYHMVWIQKEVLPYVPALFEHLLSFCGIPYVVDVDDAISHIYDQHRLLPVRFVLSGKIASVLAKASLVVAGNRYLAEQAKAAGCTNVVVLPTVVDLERYPLLKCTSAESGELRIGWIGTPFTARYLDLIHAPLKAVAETMPIRLVTVGGRPSFTDVPTEFIPWDEATEVEAIRSFDVGIMPLLDSAFERGKCGYKLIQCMALAKPVIASPVGVNNNILHEYKCGCLPGNDMEWARSLVAMADPGFRTELGQAGRNAVEGSFSLQAVAGRLVAALTCTAQKTALYRRTYDIS